MENKKYYQDIKNFPSQFQKGFELAANIKVEGKFNRIILCGMGGSSSFAELINDFFAQYPEIKLRIEPVRSYSLPKNVDDNTLVLVVSHSGNTEEAVSCLEDARAKKVHYVVIASGGKLLELGKAQNDVVYQIPTGVQPRLSTGYFIGGILKILANSGIIADKEKEVLAAAEKIDQALDENHAKQLAKKIAGKVAVIYGTDNNASLARISAIKFQENSKTQAFWNAFPELNHNEMVGYTNLVMQPIFLIFQSQFAHPRNVKRIEIFSKLMREKGLEVELIPMQGTDILAEILNAYYFIDHVTYYLAVEYGVDPEVVDMVEDFKKMLS